MDDKIQIFEDKRIRTAWNEETEEWYFPSLDSKGNSCAGIKVLEALSRELELSIF